MEQIGYRSGDETGRESQAIATLALSTIRRSRPLWAWLLRQMTYRRIMPACFSVGAGMAGAVGARGNAVKPECQTIDL